jgi:hypothetical protein
MIYLFIFSFVGGDGGMGGIGAFAHFTIHLHLLSPFVKGDY